MIEHPSLLWLLLLAVPVILAYLYWYRRNRTHIISLAGIRRKKTILSGLSTMGFVRATTIVLFVVFAVFSLAGFRWGNEVRKDERTGIDIALIFDVSRSMLAEDITPSRFAAAKRLAEKIIDRHSGDRIGIAAYRGEGVKILPVTEDATALLQFLETMNIDIVTTPGTDMEKGLQAGFSVFLSQVDTKRVLILFTDGEYHSGNPEIPLSQAKAEGIKTFLVGIGSEKGTVIPLSDGRVVENERGQPVVSRLRRKELEEMAGRFDNVTLVLYSSREHEERLFNELEKIREGEMNEQFIVEEKRQYRLFLMIGLLFLAGHITAGLMEWSSNEE